MDTEITRTQKTEEEYLYRARNLVKRYEREMGGSFITAPDEFLSWVVSLKPNVKVSTWRKYKSSVVHLLRVNGMDDVISGFMEIGSEGCGYNKPGERSRKKVVRNTSSMKKKGVSKEDEKKLTEWFRSQKDTSTEHWTTRTMAFLLSGIYTGLRPTEWPGTQFIEKLELENGEKVGPVLKVRNAKHTNGRAHGEFRHLILSELSGGQIAVIKAHMNLVKESENPSKEKVTFDKYYHACRNTMHRASVVLWRADRSLKPTLYSGRHQFAANLKAAGYSRAEIAALMGHAVDDTADEHYGRKSAGRGGYGLAKPLQEEVLRVREVLGTTPSPRKNLK